MSYEPGHGLPHARERMDFPLPRGGVRSAEAPPTRPSRLGCAHADPAPRPNGRQDIPALKWAISDGNTGAAEEWVSVFIGPPPASQPSERPCPPTYLPTTGPAPTCAPMLHAACASPPLRPAPREARSSLVLRDSRSHHPHTPTEIPQRRPAACPCPAPSPTRERGFGEPAVQQSSGPPEEFVSSSPAVVRQRAPVLASAVWHAGCSMPAREEPTRAADRRNRRRFRDGSRSRRARPARRASRADPAGDVHRGARRRRDELHDQQVRRVP